MARTSKKAKAVPVATVAETADVDVRSVEKAVADATETAPVAASGETIELRAVTGPDYGRIWDHELVAAVMRIAGNGTGDTMWKVPGMLDWATMTHNPFVDITRDTTTLYASDRDVFLFLVDDTHPIEAGRLPKGEPDLYFRGFYCWNSEVGSKTLGIASFYLRAVCMNRNLWGVEGFEEISIRHSKFAAQRFAAETGMPFQKAADGEYVTGAYRQRFALASGRFAMIDDGLGFKLVPWTPSIEKHIGQHISGVARADGGVDWSFGRKRGLGL